MPIFNNALAGASGAGGGGVVSDERSLRFNRTDDSYLSRTPSSAGTRTKWTWAAWVKRSSLGVNQELFSAARSGNETLFEFDSANRIVFYNWVGGYQGRRTTSAVFHDCTAWYHIVLVWDSGNSTASARIKIIVNGVTLDTFATTLDPPQNSQTTINDAYAHRIGDYSDNPNYNFNGYLAHVFFIDGLALDHLAFTEFDANGVQQPKDYTGSYGSNGFHLDFKDNSSSSALGNDAAGSNNWTVNNLFVGGVNYSSGVSSPDGAIESSNPAANLFDGSLSTRVNTTAAGTTVRWTPPTTTTWSSSLRVNTGAYSGGVVIRSGGTNYTLSSNGSNVASPYWLSHPNSSGTIEYIEAQGHIGAGSGYMRAIEIDGTILVDGGETDSRVDSPSQIADQTDSGAGGTVVGNYATFNPLQKNSGVTLSDGNLKLQTNSNSWKTTQTTFGMKTGKFYWEFGPYIWKDNGNHCQPGIAGMGIGNLNEMGGTNYSAFYHWSGTKFFNGQGGAGTSFGAAWNDSETNIIGIAFDADTRKVWFSKNGVWQGSGNPSAGTNEAGIINLYGDGTYSPTLGSYGFLNGGGAIANFGSRAFTYSAPTGFKSLNTANLPTPTIADGSKYFDTKLYTGTGSNLAVTGLEFSPDMIWTKSRSATDNHILVDQVRGVGNIIIPNTSGAESAYSAFISFDSNGFTKAAAESVNNRTYAAWAWDAGDDANPTTIAAGSLNSSSYNQSQTWSNGTQSGNAPWGSSSWDNVFDGVIPYNFDQSKLVYQVASGGVFTFSSAISGRIQVYSALGSSGYNSGNTIVLSDGTSQEVTNGNSSFVLYDFGTKSNITSITLNGAGNSSGLGVPGILLDGKLLVDAGVTPPNVPSIASTVRAQPSAGFSIVKYTSSGISSMGHGLNAEPELILAKALTGTHGWKVYAKPLGTSKVLFLDEYVGQANGGAGYWSVSSTTFGSALNSAGHTYPGRGDQIAYCFSSVDGYSKISSYVGSGNQNFVYLGFTPAWVMIKRYTDNTVGEWSIYDTTRTPHNEIVHPLIQSQKLWANNASAEEDHPNNAIAFVSNGFVVDLLSNAPNVQYTNNGNVGYLYAAFASHPFKSARAF